MEIEEQVTCPTCWQVFTVLLDASVPSQSYVQDCEICCNPFGISYSIRDGALISFEAKALGA